MCIIINATDINYTKQVKLFSN